MTRLEACHDSLGDALPCLHVLWGVITFPAGFYNYPMDKDFIARKLLSYLQPLQKLLTLWHIMADCDCSLLYRSESLKETRFQTASSDSQIFP
jgi:hypothetical protein